MKPMSPVIPGERHKEVVFARNQPEYQPLPTIIHGRQEVAVSRWKLSFMERIKILLTGNLYLQQITFGQPLQPQLPSADAPRIER